MKKLFILFIAVVGFGISVFAQGGPISAQASATIITPIALSKTADLNFGLIVAGGTAGSVKILTTDAAQYTTVALGTAGALSVPTTCAKFKVDGTADATFTITVPANFIITNTALAGGTMNVSNLIVTTTVGSAITQTTGTIASNGTRNIYVGADLAVGVSQNPGLYTNGTAFSLTVAYQ